jgi:immunoglobulin-like protein involved in spore germination
VEAADRTPEWADGAEEEFVKTHSIFGFSQMAISVAAIVVALAIGSWLARPAEDRGFVAGSATASYASSSPATTTSATATPAQNTTVVEQPAVEKAVAEEDMSGYPSTTSETIEDAGDGVITEIVDWRASDNDVAPALGRFVVELKPTNSTERPSPKLTATLEKQNDPKQAAKWLLRLELPDATWQQAQGEASVKMVGTTPIRQVAAYPLGANGGVGFGISLDDARPWRVGVLHNPLRVVVDVGGAATSDSIAVYSPRAGETPRKVTISGFARVFEATVSWRINDAAGHEVAKGFTNASIGTSPIWGSFQTTATVPANVTGNLTLEVFWASPRDGADLGLVRIPLTVR